MVNSQKTFICVVETIEDYYSLCSIFSLGEWIYRGQADARWSLKTSLERALDDKRKYFEQKADSHNPLVTNLKKDWEGMIEANYDLLKINNLMSFLPNKEYHAIQKYKELSHHNYLKNEMIKLLCDIQHFEGKTRLIDFTKSIAVALYFAFKNKHSLNSRCIWGINYRTLKYNLLCPKNFFLYKIYVWPLCRF